MNEFKGTPGNWEVGLNGNEKTSIWVGGSRIAVIDEFPHIGSEANARLIASSPILLNALIGLVSAYKENLTYIINDDAGYNNALAAINKALGN